MPRVLLLHTGGTLGMAGRRPHGLRPAEFHRTLRRRAPELFALAELEFELFSNLDSAEMQPELWTDMAAHLHHRLDDFDGAVVTHGTDTLAYTAAALSFMLAGLDKAVVLTGSQRPLGEIRSDARLNLVDAVTSALRGPREVTVCFDSKLLRGNRVRKVKVSEYDAFESPNFPLLGTLGVEARFAGGLRRRGRRTLRAGLVPRVFLLKTHPGMDPALPLSLLPHVEGLVVEAYGAGNVPVDGRYGRSLRPLLAEARRRRVPVVLTSEAHRGEVDLTLYEPGVVAAEEGAISGGDLTSSAALVKLMHALAHHPGLERVRAYMERDVCGERTDGRARPPVA